MVLGHMSLVSSEWGRFIFIFHMPLFFVLSGMLYKEVSDKMVLTKKLFRKLIVPYLIIALIWCIIYMGLWAKNGMWESKYWIGYQVGTFISPGKPFLHFKTLREPLWFLLALAEIKLLASYLKKTWIMVTVSVICVITILLLSHYGIVLPLAIDSALFAFPFYTTGVLLKNYLLKDYGVIVNIVLVILYIGLTYLMYRFNGVVNTNRCHYGNNIILYYIGGLTGTLFVAHLSKLIASYLPIGGLFFTIVSGAMLIIGFSQNISSAIRTLLPFLGGSNCGGIVIGILTFAISYPLIILAKEYFPAIVGFRK